MKNKQSITQQRRKTDWKILIKFQRATTEEKNVESYDHEIQQIQIIVWKILHTSEVFEDELNN